MGTVKFRRNKLNEHTIKMHKRDVLLDKLDDIIFKIRRIEQYLEKANKLDIDINPEKEKLYLSLKDYANGLSDVSWDLRERTDVIDTIEI